MADAEESQLAQTAEQTELESWLTLSMVPGVGPLLLRDLLKQFGSAKSILDAAPSELRTVPRLGPKLCRAICSANESINVQEELERCRQNDIRLLTLGDGIYPETLSQIDDPPSVLFTRGTILPQDDMAIAIVGTRHATHYGRKHARRLAAGLARAGLTVVSGLARGIDTEAHKGALDANGRTLAILGSGLLEIYPAENKELATAITKQGAVISESSTLSKPSKGSFPRRNRIVTGLCQGVIVVEAGDRSGAMISARLAMEQGREVFAVPGPVDSRNSRGCHKLIRDGAKLVEDPADVLDELGPMFKSATDAEGREVHHPGELQLNDQERAVLDAIRNDPTNIDEVVENCGLPVHRVLSTVSVLEMRSLIRRLSGMQVVRV